MTNDIDRYIAGFPENIQMKLDEIRAIIRKAAPDAEEVISYKMPAYKQNGILVYFAGYAKHIGFYPTSSPIKVFEKDLAKYTWSKGAVQFPLDKKLPAALITKMVKYRIAETNAKKSTVKKRAAKK